MKNNFKDIPGRDRTRAMTAFIKDFARSAAEAKNSSELIRFLAFAAKSHNYSLNNTILIWCQKPESTYVRGYRQWQKTGRNVKKGQRPSSSLSPHRRRSKR